jgi:hypothetical protein
MTSALAVIMIMAITACSSASTTSPLTSGSGTAPTVTAPTTTQPSNQLTVHTTVGGYSYQVTATNLSVSRDTTDAPPGESYLIPTGTLTLTNSTQGHNAPWVLPALGFVWPYEDNCSSEGGASFQTTTGMDCVVVPIFTSVNKAEQDHPDLVPGGSVSYILNFSGYYNGAYIAQDSGGSGTGLLPAGTSFIVTTQNVNALYRIEGNFNTTPVPAQWIGGCPVLGCAEGAALAEASSTPTTRTSCMARSETSCRSPSERYNNSGFCATTLKPSVSLPRKNTEQVR